MAKNYYMVNFTFTIPVAVDQKLSPKQQEIDAYYRARDEFSYYHHNEADVSMKKITDVEFKNAMILAKKLHNNYA